jgi:NAD(P)-dependent dehydrogenase (short-subunit alcohol dehydrogenase family)
MSIMGGTEHCANHALMTEPRLKGKVVLITGASRGGGKGIALVLGEQERPSTSAVQRPRKADDARPSRHDRRHYR